MPARMIHYLVAEEVAKQVEIKNRNRFTLGSLCPDMSTREDGSKHRTHFMEMHGDKKGCNWMTYLSMYGEKMRDDDFYIGVFCHIITDVIWYHDIMDTQVRSKVKTKEERQALFIKGYEDYHRLNYILKKEFGLVHHLEEDRNLELEGLHPELYEDVVQGLYSDFFVDPPAEKEDLEIYTYEISLACIYKCIEECVNAVTAFRRGEEMISPGKYYVKVY